MAYDQTTADALTELNQLRTRITAIVQHAKNAATELDSLPGHTALHCANLLRTTAEALCQAVAPQAHAGLGSSCRASAADPSLREGLTDGAHLVAAGPGDAGTGTGSPEAQSGSQAVAAWVEARESWPASTCSLGDVVLVPTDQMDDLMAEYAKTVSNFEEFADGALETHKQLRGALETLRRRMELADAAREQAEREHASAEAFVDAITSTRPSIAAWAPSLALRVRLLVEAIEQYALHGYGTAVDALADVARQARAALAALDRDEAPATRSWANAAIAATMTHLTNTGRHDLADHVRELFAAYHQMGEQHHQVGHALDAGDLGTAQALYAGLPHAGDTEEAQP